MTSRVRTHVAALMLLAPAATLMVGAPAAAQQRATVATAPYIESFEVRGSNRFEPGRELRFRLQGTPGARAWVDIPNVIRGLELRETRRGVYEGTYVVTRRDDRRDVDRAVASLQDNNYRVTARVALRDDDEERPGRGRDNAPPQITDLSPAQGARVDDDGSVRISARFIDERRNNNRGNDRRRIDADDVTLRVDGRDVTRQARIDGDGVEYRADLPRGRHTAELLVRDRAGNVARQEWSFDVVERERRDNAPPQITDLSPAQGARVDDAGRVRISARITDPRRGNDRRVDPDGVTLRVDGRDVTREARIRGDEVEYSADLPRGRHTVELTARDRAGNVARQAWSFDVVERAGRDNARDNRDAQPALPLPLRLTSHAENGSWNVQRPTVLVGNTAPHAKVHVSVESFADWAPEKGRQNVLLYEVQADANGNFVVPANLARYNPMTPRHYEYYIVTVTATLGKAVAVERVRLVHR